MILMHLAAEKKKFTMSLCTEHLDEAAFLYAQCRHLLAGTSAPWNTAQRFEERLCAHLDALSIEGKLALDVCETRTDSTDPGGLYAAVRLCCRTHQPDRIADILENLSLDNEKKVLAVCNAFIDEAPDHQKQIPDILAAHSVPTRVTAKVAVNARLKDAWPLVVAMKAESPAVLALMLRLAGRIYETGAVPLLFRSLGHDDDNVRKEAALALLRLGHGDDVIRRCRSQKQHPLALALAGGRPEAAFLIQHAQNGPVTQEILIALGLLGEVAAVPILIEGLKRKETSEQAALALELITGADIKEHIFVPDPIDKKELFQEELEKFEQGQTPYPAGKEPGITICQYATNPEQWQKWLGQNHQRFTPGTRYRNGKRFAPQCLIQNMKSENLPQYLRQLAYEEMVIRYKKDFNFETQRPASFQKQAIEKYEQWLKSTDKSFDEGQWYFAGRLIT